MSPTEAVVYIPDDVEGDDGLYARRGVAHIERRGHRFVGVLRNAERVIRMAREGVVVVFAHRSHSDTLQAEGIKRECVGEDTRRLVPIVQEAAADGAGSHRPVGQYSGQAAPFDESPTVAILDRRRTTIKQHNGRVWMSRMAIRQDDTACNVRQIGDAGPTATAPSARFVHSVIFGDAPAPAGMDSEMIAAARRIARRLWPN